MSRGMAARQAADRKKKSKGMKRESDVLEQQAAEMEERLQALRQTLMEEKKARAKMSGAPHGAIWKQGKQGKVAGHADNVVDTHRRRKRVPRAAKGDQGKLPMKSSRPSSGRRPHPPKLPPTSQRRIVARKQSAPHENSPPPNGNAVQAAADERLARAKERRIAQQQQEEIERLRAMVAQEEGPRDDVPLPTAQPQAPVPTGSPMVQTSSSLATRPMLATTWSATSAVVYDELPGPHDEHDGRISSGVGTNDDESSGGALLQGVYDERSNAHDFAAARASWLKQRKGEVSTSVSAGAGPSESQAGGALLDGAYDEQANAAAFAAAREKWLIGRNGAPEPGLANNRPRDGHAIEVQTTNEVNPSVPLYRAPKTQDPSKKMTYYQKLLAKQQANEVAELQTEAAELKKVDLSP